MNERVAPTLSLRQVLALVLCAALAVLLIGPFLSDVGRRTGDWVYTLPYFVVGASVVIGMVTTVLDPVRSGVTTLDRVRVWVFWTGAALVPASLLLRMLS